MQLFHSFSTGVAATVHRRDGRQEPGDRLAQRRPRGGGRGDHAQRRSASAARSARRTRASTSSGRSTTSSSGCSSRRPRQITIGDPLVRANWLGPIIDQRAVDRHQTAVAEARRDGTVFTGGEHLTDGDLARGFYVEPTVVGGLPAVAPPVPRRAVRAVHRGRRGRLARRGDHAGQRHRPRPDGRRLQRGPGRGPARSSTAIQAGVLYVNRRAGATTGAWPGDPGVRRLEGERLDRQGRPVDVLRRAVHARAEPHRRRLAGSRGRAFDLDADALGRVRLAWRRAGRSRRPGRAPGRRPRRRAVTRRRPRS